MKTLQDFMEFTNIKKDGWKLVSILIISSLLYCMIMAFVHTIIYLGSTIAYYIVLYVSVLLAAYIYMILLFYFLQKKRGVEEKLKLAPYVFPLIGVQSILFVLMFGSGLSFYLANAHNTALLGILMTPVCILLLMLYVPVQTFALFSIYDGKRNPFIILTGALKKSMKHYRLCFYALFVLLLIAMIYAFFMNMLFDVKSVFLPFNAVQDIVINANPFTDALSYATYAMQNASLWSVVLVSSLYGIVMCIALVFYYMIMLCAYDEDIKI